MAGTTIFFFTMIALFLFWQKQIFVNAFGHTYAFSLHLVCKHLVNKF